MKEDPTTDPPPLVSIITVVLNARDTIERCVRSVLEQSYPHLEYIVIDGHSTDGTWKLLQGYSERIDRLVQEKDEGIYDAMNKGIAMASGDLIGILNADDHYFPQSVEHAVETQRSEKAGIVHADLEVRFPDERRRRINRGDVSSLPYKASVNHPTCFVHRDVYQKLGPYDTRYRISADHEFLLRAYLHEVRFAYVDEVLVSYLHGGASLTCRSDLETYRILKEHGTGHHLKCLTRFIKCVVKKRIKKLLGKRI